MSVALPKGSATPPRTSTSLRNDLSGRPLRSYVFGNCASRPDPRKNVARFLTDCEAPARAELARRERGGAGWPWEKAGDAARRAIRAAAVADGGAR